jgi:hypothetical protein
MVGEIIAVDDVTVAVEQQSISKYSSSWIAVLYYPNKTRTEKKIMVRAV